MKESTKFIQYFGFEPRMIKWWSKRGVSFRKLYKEMVALESLRLKRSLFYETFRSINADEGKIDTLWERFIDAHLKRLQKIETLAQVKRLLRDFVKEIEEGRVL